MRVHAAKLLTGWWLWAIIMAVMLRLMSCGDEVRPRFSPATGDERLNTDNFKPG